MSEEPTPYTTGAVTAPPGWDDAPRPKRNGSRGLLPSTWFGRVVRLGYIGMDGKGVETSGTLLDYCGTGPIFAIGGAKILIGWERICLLELEEGD